jgi:hypothetical protein
MFPSLQHETKIKLHNFCSTSSINPIKVNKSSHAMGEIKLLRTHLEDLIVDGRIILKWIPEIYVWGFGLDLTDSG